MAVAVVPRPVMRMAGILPSNCRTRRSISRPDRSGSSMSRMTTSGRYSASLSSPSAAVPAVITQMAVSARTPLPSPHGPGASGGDLLRGWLNSSLVLPEDWETLPAPTRQELMQCPEPAAILRALVEHNLLTPYQAARVEAGKLFGLLL